MMHCCHHHHCCCHHHWCNCWHRPTPIWTNSYPVINTTITYTVESPTKHAIHQLAGK